MNAKAEQKERSHSAILESASRLLRERGIAGASVADVMKAAGLTVGGFYAHFSCKKELIDDALRRTAREVRERLFARLTEKPVEGRAEVVLKRYLSAAHRDDSTPGEHREVLGEQIDAVTSELATHLPPARAGVRRRHLALGLVALMYGGLSLARALRGTGLSDEVLEACRALGRLAARTEMES